MKNPLPLPLAFVATTLAFSNVAFAQEDCDATCQATRKAQDPLAAITALMTDNTIGYGPNDEDTTYNYQIQPVHTFEGENANVILRGLIPIIGAPDGAGRTEYGLGDAALQMFYVPNVDAGAFKLGYGVQFAFDTAENERFARTGNGGGFAVVGFGFSGNLSYGGILGQMWGENDFSTTTVQPIVFYNMENFLGGSYAGYSNTLSYDWKIKSGNRWTIPLGATLGKTFVVGGGNAIDVNLGAYKLVQAPSGSNDWQLKFGLSWFLP